ncbi:hypothetical protein [Marinilabilia rubra]|uniref:Glycoside hydrolase family 5 domain-containing protein n=1 Tax=Marinilabilia rubra TaxID=2162893 RepID=A0A2U2B604_9BACT|nr:hypothetical protein [Marinilabilia rubra]PWD98509.1 hypothetical protein DDZ16_14820 [Marinilabilia rubra]
MKTNKAIFLFLIVMGMAFFSVRLSSAQEIGCNFNHNPEIIDFKYLEKIGVEWVRTTPRILDYVYGDKDLNNDEAIDKVVEAGKKGYKLAFGFRWGFKKYGMDIPKPGSKEEKKLFETERAILRRVGPYVDVFKLGNEPNLETKKSDMMPQEDGSIPLVRFTKRQFEEVVLPFFEDELKIKTPDVYIGSFPRLFMKDERTIPGVMELIRMAHSDDRITGLAVHLHISSLDEIDESFEFVRDLMPDKPIIIPEFSLHRLYQEKSMDSIGSTPVGRSFAKKFGRDPSMKFYEWGEIANTKGVSRKEWEAFFMSRSWFPPHYLKEYQSRFTKYGVVLATFPLLQQSCPENMTPNSPMWFINPLYCQKSLIRMENGDYASNPLVFEDFIDWLNATRK